MKISKKSISLIVASTLLQSTFAFAQLTPGSIEAQAQQDQQRLEEQQRRQREHQQGGLTPAQVEADSRRPQIDPRELERIARDRILADQARQERIRQQIEFDRQEHIREEARMERIRQQAEFDRQEAARQQQAIFDQQQADLARQAAELEAQRQAQIEADRQAALRGSASIVFTNVTRKTHGEWLRVSLTRPMVLSQIKITVLEAAVQIHQAILHLDNGQSLTVNSLNETGTFGLNEVRGSDLRNIQNRIVAIDVRAESMGAQSILNVTLDSIEGTPVLTKTRFMFK